MLSARIPAFLTDKTLTLWLRLATALSILTPWLLLMGNAPADIAISLVGVLFLVDSFFAKDWRWVKQGWIIAALILTAYMLARSIFTPEQADAISRSLTFIRYPLFAVALACWVWRVPEVSRLLFVSLASSLVFLFFDCFLQFAVGYDIIGRPVFPTDTTSIRLTGPFSAPKVGIHIAWLVFPVMAVLTARSIHLASRRDRFTGVAFVILFLTVVFITGERMALLLSLFGCALLFLAHPPLRLSLAGMMLASLLVIAVLAQYNPSLFSRQYFSTVQTMDKADESPYGQIWGSSLKMLEAYPVFGVGPKQFRHYCPEPRFGDTQKEPHRCNLHPHHLYLEWAVETGFVGLIIFAVMISLMLKPALKNYRELKSNPLFLGLLIAMAIRLWPLSTATSFYANWSAIPFWLIAGWLLALTTTCAVKK